MSVLGHNDECNRATAMFIKEDDYKKTIGKNMELRCGPSSRLRLDKFDGTITYYGIESGTDTHVDYIPDDVYTVIISYNVNIELNCIDQPCIISNSGITTSKRFTTTIDLPGVSLIVTRGTITVTNLSSSHCGDGNDTTSRIISYSFGPLSMSLDHGNGVMFSYHQVYKPTAPLIKYIASQGNSDLIEVRPKIDYNILSSHDNQSSSALITLPSVSETNKHTSLVRSHLEMDPSSLGLNPNQSMMPKMSKYSNINDIIRNISIKKLEDGRSHYYNGSTKLYWRKNMFGNLTLFSKRLPIATAIEFGSKIDIIPTFPAEHDGIRVACLSQVEYQNYAIERWGGLYEIREEEKSIDSNQSHDDAKASFISTDTEILQEQINTIFSVGSKVVNDQNNKIINLENQLKELASRMDIVDTINTPTPVIDTPAPVVDTPAPVAAVDDYQQDDNTISIEDPVYDTASIQDDHTNDNNEEEEEESSNRDTVIDSITNTMDELLSCPNDVAPAAIFSSDTTQSNNTGNDNFFLEIPTVDITTVGDTVTNNGYLVPTTILQNCLISSQKYDPQTKANGYIIIKPFWADVKSNGMVGKVLVIPDDGYYCIRDIFNAIYFKHDGSVVNGVYNTLEYKNKKIFSNKRMISLDNHILLTRNVGTDLTLPLPKVNTHNVSQLRLSWTINCRLWKSRQLQQNKDNSWWFEPMDKTFQDSYHEFTQHSIPIKQWYPCIYGCAPNLLFNISIPIHAESGIRGTGNKCKFCNMHITNLPAKKKNLGHWTHTCPLILESSNTIEDIIDLYVELKYTPGMSEANQAGFDEIIEKTSDSNAYIAADGHKYKLVGNGSIFLNKRRKAWEKYVNRIEKIAKFDDDSLFNLFRQSTDGPDVYAKFLRPDFYQADRSMLLSLFMDGTMDDYYMKHKPSVETTDQFIRRLKIRSFDTYTLVHRQEHEQQQQQQRYSNPLKIFKAIYPAELRYKRKMRIQKEVQKDKRRKEDKKRRVEERKMNQRENERQKMEEEKRQETEDKRIPHDTPPTAPLQPIPLIYCGPYDYYNVPVVPADNHIVIPTVYKPAIPNNHYTDQLQIPIDQLPIPNYQPVYDNYEWDDMDLIQSFGITTQQQQQQQHLDTTPTNNNNNEKKDEESIDLFQNTLMDNRKDPHSFDFLS